MSHTVYLDESGDLGFKFSKPYMHGGSSRYLTIAFFVVPNSKDKYLKRLVRKIYKKYNFQPGTEVKASDLNISHKNVIASEIKSLIKTHSDITVCSITVNKQGVYEHIKKEPNLLYNYMMKLSILDKVNHLSKFTLLRDNRSVKVSSGNSLAEYLQTTLWFEHGSETALIDKPSDSKQFLNLILTDWLNNIVWNYYEHKNESPFKILSPMLKNQTLYF